MYMHAEFHGHGVRARLAVAVIRSFLVPRTSRYQKRWIRAPNEPTSSFQGTQIAYHRARSRPHVRRIVARWPGEAHGTCVEVASMCCAGPGGACGMKHATRMAMTWHAMGEFRQARCLQAPWVGSADMPATSCVCKHSEHFDMLLFRKNLDRSKL